MITRFIKRRFVFCMPVILLVSLFILCAPQKKAELIPLFNGMDLAGWVIPEQGKWLVENGEIIARGDEEMQVSPCLMTVDVFEDFVLRLKFLADEGARGGVVIRVPSGAEGKPEEAGYKVQIDFKDEANPTGSLVGLAPAYKSRGKYTLAGETVFADEKNWNDLEIAAAGDYIGVKINGYTAVERYDRKSLKGKIGLQITDKSIRFRDIEILKKSAEKQLGPTFEERLNGVPGEFVKIFNGNDLEGWKVLWGGDWKVVDGVIQGGIEEGMGWLITEKSYQNFIYRIKVKISEGGNSGLTVRYPWPPDPANLTWDAASKNDDLNPAFGGYEIQILNYDEPGITNPSGAIYDVARAYPEKLKRKDWNQYEVYASGPHMAVYINGEKVSETLHTRSLSGGVGMQVHVIKSELEAVDNKIEPHKVMFKDIEIKEIK